MLIETKHFFNLSFWLFEQNNFQELKTVLLSRTFIKKKALEKINEELPSLEYIQISLKIQLYDKSKYCSEDAYEEYLFKVSQLKVSLFLIFTK